MESYCDCDSNGVCDVYNTSRFSSNEIEFHKQWPAVFNQELNQWNNISVCYCSSGWTGYSDLGIFQHEALQNCASSVASMNVLWAISSIAMVFIICSKAYIDLQHSSRNSAICSHLPRYFSILSFAFIGITKLVYAGEPWMATIGISPNVTSLYVLGNASFMFDMSHTQHKHVSRYFSKIFKDFGFGNKVKVERVQIMLGVRIQQTGTTLGAIFFGIATMQNNQVVRSASLVGLYAVAYATILVDLFVIEPRTNSRFLSILKNMIHTNVNEESNKSSTSFVRMNSANDDAVQRLRGVHRRLAIQTRTKKIQSVTFLMSCIPLYYHGWWKYLGYNLVFVCFIYSIVGALFHLNTLLRRGWLKKPKKTGTAGRTQVKSTEVSAFKSTVVAPL